MLVLSVDYTGVQSELSPERVPGKVLGWVPG